MQDIVSATVIAVARAILLQKVVGRIIYGAKIVRRPRLIAFRCVVVDHVENHLDSRFVESLHHGLELRNLCSGLAPDAVGAVQSKEAERHIAPEISLLWVKLEHG